MIRTLVIIYSHRLEPLLECILYMNSMYASRYFSLPPSFSPSPSLTLSLSLPPFLSLPSSVPLFLPPSLPPSLFSFLSPSLSLSPSHSVFLQFIYHFWQATPSHTLWECNSNILNLSLKAIHTLCWFSVACSLFTIDYLELLGIKQVHCRFSIWFGSAFTCSLVFLCNQDTLK